MKTTELNDPLKLIPYGFVATRAWLFSQGVERYTLDNWVKQGRLLSLTPGVLARSDTKKLTWQGVVCSLQHLMKLALVPGGLTALELQGMEHYLPLAAQNTVHLYGPDALPKWVSKVLPDTVFVYHNTRRVFGGGGLRNDVYNTQTDVHTNADPLHVFSRAFAWGFNEWPLTISTPERALFEMLLDVPEHMSLEHADKLMQGLATLSPRRLNKLMEHCTSVKVKRLFLWLAERHEFPWYKKLDLDHFNMKSGALGSGKRMLVKGGKLDQKYLITVPEELYGHY